MRTTAMAALVAVGVLAAAGTDRTDEALPGESPFTKAPTTASLALLATTIGGGVSAPVTASANSGALIGATFAFNTVGGGAVTQTGAAGQAGAGGAAAPNSLIGGGVSAPVTASANSGPALVGATFAFNTVGGGAVTQNRGRRPGRRRRRRRGTQLAHRRRRICTGYGVCEQRPGPDRRDLCVQRRGRWRSDPDRGRRPGRRRRGTQLAHRRRRICTGYGVCEQRPGPDRRDLCVQHRGRWRSDPDRGRRPGRRRRGTQLAHRRRRICTGYGVCEQRPGPDRRDLCVQRRGRWRSDPDRGRPARPAPAAPRHPTRSSAAAYLHRLRRLRTAGP